MGVGNLVFNQSFLLGFVLNDDLLGMLASYGKSNMYLHKFFTCSCSAHMLVL